MIDAPRPRRAQPGDLAAVTALLGDNALPVAGVAEHLGAFRVAEANGVVQGCAGVEIHGSVALLRSVCVSKELRRNGIARRLVEAILQDATQAGVRTVYLLTESAERYFGNFGFSRLPRASAPVELAGSAEFQGACPASAVLMGRRSGPAVRPPRET